MNLPNKLTLTRIILVPVFMIFVSLTSLDGIVDGNFNATFYLLAGIVFAAASFTDYLDGHLARKWHMVTDFGKFADPLADKLLTTVAFIYMLRDGVCSPVVLCIILARGGCQCQGRQGHRRQHVGQGQDRAADAEHHLLLLRHCPELPRYGGQCFHRGGGLYRPVLAGGRCDRHFRHQVPVG